ncbi:hypothetical protein B0J14DRAFT_579017 [Halenospora varia]|nr:hypothetical protein B0J14DRAFT_579017 [Halenospora varia]
MGSWKPKAKSGKRNAKTSSKRKARDKVAGLTNANFTPLPAKSQKSKMASENKSSVLSGPDLVTGVPLSTVNTSTPSVKIAGEALKHAKWPALLKKHMGVLESHIKALDRVLQNIMQLMEGMPEEERGKWERGEKGKFVVVAGSLDRVRDAYVCAKMVAEGVVESNHLRDKKGLGVKGCEFERLLPGILEKARAAGIRGEGLERISIGRPLRAVGELPDDEVEDEDTEMEDVSDISVESESESSTTSAGEDEATSKKASLSDDESTILTRIKPNAVPEVEPNPYFVIDSNPTPVNVPAPTSRLSKKRTASGEHVKPVKKAKKEKAVNPAPESEATIESTKVSKKDKKHSSDDGSEEKPSKKAKKQKTVSEIPTPIPTPTTVPVSPPTNGDIHPSRKRAIDLFEKQEEAKAKRMKAYQPATTATTPIPPPRPINSDSNSAKPNKKKRTTSNSEDVPSPQKKLKNSPEPEAEQKGEDFDFVAYQKKLSGEIESKEAAKAAKKEAKKDKKRRRSSDGVKREEKKVKK